MRSLKKLPDGSKEMAVKSIGLAWILVDDLKEAVKFYTEVLGLKLTKLDEESGWAELSGHEGGGRLGIGLKSRYEQIHPGKNAIISLPVEDIDKAKSELIQKGLEMVGETIEFPDFLKLQTVIDPDGNHFQLIQLFHH
jgi:predicted enzyme related to lactoylglutathione lyase